MLFKFNKFKIKYPDDFVWAKITPLQSADGIPISSAVSILRKTIMSEPNKPLETRETLVEFPCVFPLKVMGANVPEFEQAVLETVRIQVSAEQECTIQIRESSKGNYLGATVKVYVTDKPQLDNIYRSLTAHPLVKVVL